MFGGETSAVKGKSPERIILVNGWISNRIECILVWADLKRTKMTFWFSNRESIDFNGFMDWRGQRRLDRGNILISFNIFPNFLSEYAPETNFCPSMWPLKILIIDDFLFSICRKFAQEVPDLEKSGFYSDERPNAVITRGIRPSNFSFVRFIT